MKALQWALFPTALVVAAASSADPRGAALRAENLRKHVTYLASDELAGRGTGDAGNERAAAYVAEAFRRFGLRPLGTARAKDASAKLNGTGYFQPFRVTLGAEKGRSSRLHFKWKGAELKLKPGSDFDPAACSTGGDVSGELVYVGNGVQPPHGGAGDYVGIDVKGKIALVTVAPPAAGTPAQAWPLVVRGRAMQARNAGASALLIAPPTNTSEIAFAPDGFTSDSGIPVFTIKRTAAAKLLSSVGKDLTALEPKLADGGNSFATGIQVSLKADVTRRQRTTANILGLLEGSDPKLKDEIVVVGAHMDHLGWGHYGSLAPADKKNAIHHGADDNASGTAGVLALAEFYSSSTTRPRRSILFMCFSGEELGLLGSAHYCKNPVLPLDKTVAMLNMDMIGRMNNNKLIIGGTSTATGFNALLDSAAKGSAINISRSDNAFGSSDHASFYAAKVPVLFFFTGLHEDYHRPSDTSDKINYWDQERVVDLVSVCLDRITSDNTRPEYKAMPVKTEETPRFRVALGTIPDYSADVQGIRLSGVRPGGAAEKGGMKAGDVIIRFGGRTVRNVEEYTAALGQARPGEPIEIVVLRDGKEITLKVTPAAMP